jgi:hypothetical protein
MIDKTQSEHNKFGYPPIADIGADIVFRRFVPKGDITFDGADRGPGHRARELETTFWDPPTDPR